MRFRINTEKLKEVLEKYDWKELERGMRKVQTGINALTSHFLVKGDNRKAKLCTFLYMEAVRVFRTIRELIDEEKLLTDEDYEILEAEEKDVDSLWSEVIEEEK